MELQIQHFQRLTIFTFESEWVQINGHSSKTRQKCPLFGTMGISLGVKKCHKILIQIYINVIRNRFIPDVYWYWVFKKLTTMTSAGVSSAKSLVVCTLSFCEWTLDRKLPRILFFSPSLFPEEEDSLGGWKIVSKYIYFCENVPFLSKLKVVCVNH